MQIKNISRNEYVRKLSLVFLVSLISSLPLFAFQDSIRKNENDLKLLDINDLGRWEQLIGNTLSDDGNWLVYSVRNNNQELEGRLHDLTSGKVSVFKESGSFRFSNDSKWLGYIISPDFKTQEKLRTDKKPILKKFALLNLATGDSVFVNEIDSFDFSGDGKFIAIKKSKPENSTVKTSNIIVRDLKTGKNRVFGNVKDFGWSDKASLLVLSTDLPDKIGNSVMLFDGNTRSTQILDTQESDYSNLAWRRESQDLVVLRSLEDKKTKDSNNDILIWRDLSGSITNPSVFTFSNYANFPKGMRIGDKPGIQWSEDGGSLFFNIEESQEPEKKDNEKSKEEKTAKQPAEKENPDQSKTKTEDLPEIPALEIWNAGDVRTIPQQKLINPGKSYLSVWIIASNKFFQLNDENLKVRFQNNSPVLLATNDEPYQFEGMFGRSSNDIYSVDTATGLKKKILTDNPVFLFNSLSPGGKYFVFLRDDHLHLYDFTTSKSVNLTKDIDDSFVNLQDDHPVRQKYPFGLVGWDENGTYFLAHSQFDVWKFEAASGKATRLTNGKAANMEYRFEKSNWRKPTVDLNQTYYLKRMDNLTKKMGYSMVEKGTAKDIFWGEGMASGISKAENAETFAVRLESYNDSPDIFVWRNGSPELKQISNINPFEKEYKTGKAEVIQYTSANGQKLQGSLYYPDDYVSGRKYPMVTYIYELLSDGFFRNTTPSNTNYYNRRVFTSQGYFVFMPDIVFEPGDPGVSSVKTLEIAVKAVVDKGLVDEKRVGLVGHSWGGYQAAYAVTGTNIFAAVVAGAGISNLVTMYGTLTPAFGSSFESGHFEVGQERMIVPPWKNIDGYLRNSAIPNISKMQTPLLMEVGDEDKNVNWGQGLEMYNAARREKKPMILLVYAKEGHGLREPKNQRDYQKRILEWFGHYLKKDPAKKWIKDNIPYPEQQKLLKGRELE